jgi:predicted Zn-dependent peptidase
LPFPFALTPDYHLHTLPNGIRVVHKQVTHTKIAHCGFILDIGSRDEAPHQLGLAHFWEHMAFKGTQKRKAFHIINRLESVGGELNAYTTKEKICFYATLLATHFEKAFELLTDITFHSSFPQKEIEKERGVILEEMSMYLDSPDEAINDDFDGVIYTGHPLGNNILGVRESVSRFNQDDFRDFVQEHLSTDKLIFSSVSNLPFTKVVALAKKFLGDLPTMTKPVKRLPFTEYEAKTVQMEKPINQAHCVIGCPAFSLRDERRIPFFMLTNILGGPGMNSRLNLGVREKYGLVYAIDAQFSSYTDTGICSIYFGTEKKTLKRTIGLVMKEIRRLQQVPLGSTQLHVAKEQLMGQLAMAEESNSGLMMLMGRSLLDQGYIEPLNDIFEKIKKVKASELADLANEVLTEDRLSFLSYVPQD